MSHTHSFDRAVTDQRGSILLGGLILVGLMTMIGLALYNVAVIESGQIGRTETDVNAFYAADAGIHRAALDVADPDAANPVGALTFAGVKGALPANNTDLVALLGYSSTCFGSTTCDSSNNPRKPAYFVQARNDTTDPNQFWLISTACVPGPASNPCPAGSKMTQVQGEVRKVTVSTIPWGAFGGTKLAMSGSGGVADSYNSHKSGCTVPCPYGGSNIGNEGNIGSNGSIDLTSTIVVKGDIINTTNVGADPSDISLASGVTVTGSVESGGTILINGVTNPNGQSGGNGTGGTTAQVSGTVLHDTATPQVVMPALANCGPPYTDLTDKIFQYTNDTFTTLVTPANITWTYGGTKACYTCGVTGSKAGQLVVGGGKFVGFAPGTYCLGAVTFSGGTFVQVTDRTIFKADGEFTLSGGGFANVTQLPQNLQIISTYGNDAGETHTGVTLSGGSDAFAAIYAPTTMAVISGGGQLFGGVMANKVSFTGGSGVHFDEFLMTPGAGLEGGITVSTFSLLHWKRSN